jgi:hypothetical protein
MSNNTNGFRINNEQIFLINILNTMYNENLRQIDNLTETLNNINNSNNQIRNLLIQLLHNQNPSNPRRNERQYRENNNNNVNNNNRNLNNRLYLNNRPYIIDYIAQYSFPTGRNINSNQDINSLFNNFMQPVEVFPTQSQIESATRRVRYCDISRPINTQCPISMDEFNDNDMVTVIRPCGHIFHTEHLMNWFRSNCRCPVCRYDIREYNSNASTEFFTNSNQYINNTNNVLQFQTNESIDSSNNNLEGINTNINSNNITNLGTTLLNNILNDRNITDFLNLTDISGNYMDSSFTNNDLAVYLLNFINRPRNTR